MPTPKDEDDKKKSKLSKMTEPESPNISWFFDKDLDQSGSLTLSELWVRYAENNW